MTKQVWSKFGGKDDEGRKVEHKWGATVCMQFNDSTWFKDEANVLPEFVSFIILDLEAKRRAQGKTGHMGRRREPPSLPGTWCFAGSSYFWMRRDDITYARSWD